MLVTANAKRDQVLQLVVTKLTARSYMMDLQQDIALGRDNPFWYRFGVATLTGNGYSRALVKETHESLAKQTVGGISGFSLVL